VPGSLQDRIFSLFQFYILHFLMLSRHMHPDKIWP
jgi:hypothetical protein